MDIKVKLKQNVTREEFNQATFDDITYQFEPPIDLDFMKKNECNARKIGKSLDVECTMINSMTDMFGYYGENRDIWEVVE